MKSHFFNLSAEVYTNIPLHERINLKATQADLSLLLFQAPCVIMDRLKRVRSLKNWQPNIICKSRKP